MDNHITGVLLQVDENDAFSFSIRVQEMHDREVTPEDTLAMIAWVRSRMDWLEQETQRHRH